MDKSDETRKRVPEVIADEDISDVAVNEEDRDTVKADGDRDRDEDEVEEEDYSNVKCWHPAHSVHRYIFMVFMCSLGVGNYFSYDTPSSLQEETLRDMNINNFQYSLLYSLYSWPNMILSLIGGILVDRYLGINWGAIIFACFTFAGQFLLGLGAYLNSFWLMCLGRIVFAIGGENLAVTANMRAVKWFGGRELQMVFGLQLSLARVGSTVNMNVMKPLYDYLGHSYSGHQCLGMAWMLASIVAAYDLVLAIVLAVRDKWAERQLKVKDVKSDKISLKDIKVFRLNYWFINFIIVFYYVSVFPLVSFGVPFFTRKFQLNSVDAHLINSMVYLISMGASPILGILMGRLGRTLYFVLLAILISMTAHLLLAFSFLTPWLAMIVLGIGYSMLACTVWALISLVVPERTLGTAYGMTQAIQNFGLGMISMAAGAIVDTKGYLVLEIFYLAWLCATIISTMALLVLDEKEGGYLNMTPKMRDEFDSKKTNKDNDNQLDENNDMGVNGTYDPKSTQL